MARPTKNNPTGAQISPKLTPETIMKLEQAFSIDASIGEACFYADISHETYYRWIRDNPELYEKFQRLREKPVLTARRTVVKALESEVDTAMKYLEKKKKDEFSSRSETKFSGGLNITKNDYDDMSDDELNEIIFAKIKSNG